MVCKGEDNMTSRYHSCPACDAANAAAEKASKENFIKKGKLKKVDEKDSQKEV